MNTGSLRETYTADHEVDPAAESFPLLEAWLGQRDILGRIETGWVPTVAGVLVYGIEPRRLVPGAFVEFVRYAGDDFDSSVVARKTISGSLPDQLDALWTQLSNHLAEVPVEMSGIRSPYLPEYPLDTLRELARNLVQHRLYDGTNAPGRVSWLEDRIVFSNPGALFGRASEGEFGEHSDYRNPTVTRLLVELGYVERLGRGISLVRSSLRKNGNPDFAVDSDGFVTVTVRRRG